MSQNNQENTNNKKPNLVFTFGQDEAVSIKDVSTERLLISLKRMVTRLPKWAQGYVLDDNEKPYNATVTAIQEELQIRMSNISIQHDVKAVLPTLAANNAVVIEQNKQTVVLTEHYKPIPMVQIAGNVVPEQMHDVHNKCVISNFVDGFFYSLTAKRMNVITEVKMEDAAKIGFPLRHLTGGSLKGGDYSRAEFIKQNTDAMLEDRSIAHTLSKALPEGVKFDFSTGRFTFPAPKMIVVTTIKHMYYVIQLHRNVRGVDTDARNAISAGYYYDIASRTLYTVAYVAHDIITLGETCGTHVLEISAPDSLVNAHVMSTLVSAGWLIRVVGSSIFPPRTKMPNGKYKEQKGIFSYFEHDEVYLRWTPIHEVPPKVVGQAVVMPNEPSALVKHNFSMCTSKNAIPFCYQYLNEEMREMDSFYPECSLFPTAHAHNGHIIVVRSKIMNKDNPVTVEKYIKRTILATTCKTWYVYSRIRFYEKDPYASPFKLPLRNKIMRTKEELFAIEFDDDVSTVTNFAKVFDVKTLKANPYAYQPPERIAYKRVMVEDHNKLVRKMKAPDITPEEKKVLSDEREKIVKKVEEVNEEIKKDDKKGSQISSKIETFTIETLETTEIDDSLFLPDKPPEPPGEDGLNEI